MYQASNIEYKIHKDYNRGNYFFWVIGTSKAFEHHRLICGWWVEEGSMSDSNGEFSGTPWHQGIKHSRLGTKNDWFSASGKVKRMENQSYNKLTFLPIHLVSIRRGKFIIVFEWFDHRRRLFLGVNFLLELLECCLLDQDSIIATAAAVDSVHRRRRHRRRRNHRRRRRRCRRRLFSVETPALFVDEIDIPGVVGEGVDARRRWEGGDAVSFFAMLHHEVEILWKKRNIKIWNKFNPFWQIEDFVKGRSIQQFASCGG